MLETIRQFAEEQLAANGAAADVRTAHAAYFAGREHELEELWNSARQRDVYDWLSTELPNLRTAFRWAADESQLEAAATIATYSPFLASAIENLEPLAWAEELIPAARAANHPRLPVLLALASQCWMVGRTDDSVRFADQAMAEIEGKSVLRMPFAIAPVVGGGYLACGDPQRAAQCYRRMDRLESAPVGRALIAVGLALTMNSLGATTDAASVMAGVLDDDEVTKNPYAEAFASMALGQALTITEPGRALEAIRRGIEVARQSGNRLIETYMSSSMARFAGQHGEPIEALNELDTVIQRLLDTGNLYILRNNLAILAGILDRFDRHAAAAQVLGFAVNPFVIASIPETTPTITHLRESLGDQQFDDLARVGRSMTTAAVVAFVKNEIESLRAEITAQI